MIKVPRCCKCKSKLTYLRKNGKERFCRSCGNIEKVEVIDNG